MIYGIYGGKFPHFGALYWTDQLELGFLWLATGCWWCTLHIIWLPLTYWYSAVLFGHGSLNSLLSPARLPVFLWSGAFPLQVCFSGSVLLETFDIEVVSYDGNWLMLQPWIDEAKSAQKRHERPQWDCMVLRDEQSLVGRHGHGPIHTGMSLGVNDQ